MNKNFDANSWGNKRCTGSNQTRRHGPGMPPQLISCAPPNENCAPPKRRLCSEENNRIGALERKSRPKLVFFVDLKLEKPLEIPISARKSLEYSVKPFFFLEVTCLQPEKPLEFPISAGKSL